MNLLKRLFFRGTSAVPEEGRATNIYRLSDDESYVANSDILVGLRFFATLHLTTPLNVLMHHNELFTGVPSNAPSYGTRAEGIWVPQTKSWRDLGVDVDDFPESTAASDIGPILPSQYVPFLVQFRTIVESDNSNNWKLAQLNCLADFSAEFRNIWSRVKSSHPSFPAGFLTCSQERT